MNIQRLAPRIKVRAPRGRRRESSLYYRRTVLSPSMTADPLTIAECQDVLNFLGDCPRESEEKSVRRMGSLGALPRGRHNLKRFLAFTTMKTAGSRLPDVSGR